MVDVMTKRKPANPFLGRWTIEQMDQWDVEDESEEFQPFIEFDHNDCGRFQFVCVYGEMDCRQTQRDGKTAIEFSWDGNDETEYVFSRGWAVLERDRLSGMIYFHLGDESGFTARCGAKKSGKHR
jgi:hypothetical protein